MKNNPKISLIVPVYNPGKYFIKCMDSIVNQTYRNLEIILIDDGSTDGSSKVCDDYEKCDSRIKVIHQENAGVSRARNVGLDNATGDYVSFPDSDDYIDLNTYEILLNTIEENNVGAVCFEYNIVTNSVEERHSASDGKYGVFETETSIRELLFSDRTFLSTKLLPMNAVRDLRFLEDVYRDEDTIFCMMALHNVEKTVFIDTPLYNYVQSEDSACRGPFRPNQLSAIKAIPIVEKFLKDNYPGILRNWYCYYMNLMITLYTDMYLDEKEYKLEKAKTYSTFKQLRKLVSISDMGSRKQIAKFTFFRLSPDTFCYLHKKRFDK